MTNKITIKDRVKFIKIILGGKFKPFLKNEIDENIVSEVFYKLKNLDKNNYKKRLINYLKKYYGSNNEVYLTSSGRNALFFILSNLKLRQKEVLIPSYSCLGLIEPVLNAKLKPVFADIDDNLYYPSYKSIKTFTSNRTGVVIIPHLGGTFARDTKKIIEYCKKRKIIVIEDCCQAFGLEYKRKNWDICRYIIFQFRNWKTCFYPRRWMDCNKKRYHKKFHFFRIRT